MGHIDQQQGSYLVGDLAHAGKIDDAGVGTASSDDELRSFALGDGFQDVVVNLLGLFVDTVEDDAVKLAGKAELVPVSQVAAVREVQTQDGVAGIDDRHVGGSVGLRSGVGLDIDVVGAKELLRPVSSQILDHIGKLAAAVIALAGIALGVLVGKDRANRLKHRLADKVLRGNHFQA